jgi:hypothetical protein
MGRETSPLQLLTSLLLTGGKRADPVIRGNVVLNKFHWWIPPPRLAPSLWKSSQSRSSMLNIIRSSMARSGYEVVALLVNRDQSWGFSVVLAVERYCSLTMAVCFFEMRRRSLTMVVCFFEKTNCLALLHRTSRRRVIEPHTTASLCPAPPSHCTLHLVSLCLRRRVTVPCVVSSLRPALPRRRVAVPVPPSALSRARGRRKTVVSCELDVSRVQGTVFSSEDWMCWACQ